MFIKAETQKRRSKSEVHQLQKYHSSFGVAMFTWFLKKKITTILEERPKIMATCHFSITLRHCFIQESENISEKSQRVNILGYVGQQTLSKLLNSDSIMQKQPCTVSQCGCYNKILQKQLFNCQVRFDSQAALCQFGLT